MHKPTAILLALSACGVVLLLVAVSTSVPEEVVLEVQSKAVGQVWGYSGRDGPSRWRGKCNAGRKQSPIDIPSNQAIYNWRMSPPVWEIEDGKQEPSVVFNGFTVQVTYNYASVHYDSHKWKLQNFHFHTPSEHKINGVAFPAEIQLVHRNAEGRLLIVCFFFDTQEWAPSYIPSLFDHLPITHDGAAEYNHPVPGPYQTEFNSFLGLLMQRERHGHMFYTYQGSITTPPCTEGVTYLVMSELIGINERDLKKLKKVEGKNARPVQPLNGRTIYKSFAAA